MRRFHVYIFIVLFTALCSRAQSREIDVLSQLIGVETQAESQQVVSVGSPVAASLDFVSSSAGNSDLISVLSAMSMPVSSPVASSFEILDLVSSTYSSSGFYKSGVTAGFTNFTSFLGQKSIGTLPYNCSEWGHITSSYGYREQFDRMHRGIDIAMGVGDSVRVALPGVVSKIGYEAKGYGRYVIVSHDNGMETRYAHLSLALVDVGQRVGANQTIALSGNTGNSTGPHLHFETRLNGNPVDPQTVFDFSNRKAMYNKVVSNTSKRSTYVVKAGDTLQKISDKTGVPVMRLCQLNFIPEDQSLIDGQMLKLR